MKLTEQLVVAELAKVGYGGTQAQRAAAAIVERSRLTPLERANVVDDCVEDLFKGFGMPARRHARDVVDRTVGELA